MLVFGHEDTATWFMQWQKALKLPKAYPDLQLLPLLHDRAVLGTAFGQLYDSVHMTAMTAIFERTKEYCEKSSQLSLLKQQPWYHFWRILRNCFSHNYCFTFNPHDLKVLPVSWQGFIIDASRQGTQLTHGEFPRERMWDFLRDVEDFIKKGLA